MLCGAGVCVVCSVTKVHMQHACVMQCVHMCVQCMYVNCVGCSVYICVVCVYACVVGWYMYVLWVLSIIHIY